MSASPAKTTAPAFIGQLSKKHGVSESAVETLLAALRRGGGTMAQFHHPELGGSGQWMSNGMIMVGDMFNDSLKTKVDALAHALRPHLGTDRPASSALAASSRFESSEWWPADYTSPAATGGQNDCRYAYFPRQNALVVDRKGAVSVYDTTGHDFHGFGQDQPGRGGFRLDSARGPIDLAELPKKKSAGKSPHRSAAAKRRK